MIPEIPENVPRRNSIWMRSLGRLVLKMMGWKISGDIPEHPRMVLSFAPHTSNWDFIHSFFIMMALDLNVSIMMKKEAFKWPLTIILSYFRFIAVDRKKPQGTTMQLVKHYSKADKFWLLICPEGTRKNTIKWKSGFLHIAHKSNVPVVLIALDYEKKDVNFGPVFYSEGKYNEELDKVIEHYKGFTGRTTYKKQLNVNA